MERLTYHEYWDNLIQVQRCDFTGVLTGFDRQDFAWIVKGEFHRDLGPAIVFSDGQEIYRIHGADFSRKQYWQKMYEKYKGTEHEAECLAQLLGSK